MKWNLNELNKYRNKELSFNETIDLSDLTTINQEIRNIDPIQVEGRADIGSKHATFHLHLKGKMILPCSRTLADVTFPFDIETTEVYSLTNNDYWDEGNEEIHQLNGDVLDLAPAIKENILLEIPMQIINEDDQAEGKAPQSGKGWEVITEQEEKRDKIDPRLAELQKFFDKE